MHGTSAGSPVPLGTFGGLVTLASPDSLPEGSSPRTYDTDYLVGSVGTRDGLRNVYSFNNSSVGPSPATVAQNVTTIGNPWTNPTNILLNDGSFTTVLCGSNVNVHAQPETAAVTTTNPPGGLNSALVGPFNSQVMVNPTVNIVANGTFGAGLLAQVNINFAYSGGFLSVAYTFTANFSGTFPITIPATVDVSTIKIQLTATTFSGPSGTVSANITQCYIPVPTLGTDDLNTTQYGFNLPTTASVTGIQVDLTGYGVGGSSASLQLMKNGVPVGTPKIITLPVISGVTTFGSLSDTWGAPWLYSDINNPNFGVQITGVGTFTAEVLLDYITVTIGISAQSTNFNFITTFVAQNKAVKNLALDGDGNLWVEDVTNNPGVLSLAREGITPNSFAVGVNGPDVEYLAFNDGFTGSDIPLQYTPNWIDRITQVGPAAAPVFQATSAAATTYSINNISQPAQHVWTFAFGLQSTGPGSNTPGNVVTQYYADSTLVGPDTDLVNAFNSGNPVYVYVQSTASSGGDTVGALQTPYTALVTSVGLGRPNGQSRNFYYFTYQVADSKFVWNPGQQGYAVTYERSLATINMNVPVPLLTVGDNVIISGNTVSAYNTTWTISQSINSGSMAISQSSINSSGVATYSYTVVSGANPTAGQLVTVTGTLNADGALNVVNVPIATVSGTSTGTFTVNLLPATAFGPEAEEGQAITAGTIFAFDPGILTLGTGTSPIHGTGTGGSLSISGSGQVIGSGTRQGTVFFITRNGLWTFPAPPVIFTTPDNTTTINASNIPIGPPNVIARGIAFTEAGQNGVPGANFFTIPTDVDYTVQNVNYVATSLFILDNTSTTASFTFTDSVLLNATAIDIQGFNLFNNIEIGNPGWIVQYDSRNFYGLCQNRVQNFNNLSFDGGYLPTVQLIPLGWSVPDLYGQLQVSPIFGDSYYIKNTSGGTLATAGLISQTAYLDAYQQPILNANTAYSVRVTARIPSGNTNGNLVVQLSAAGVIYGTFTLPFSSMTSSMTIFSGTLLVNEFATVPPSLILSLFASAIGVNADVEVDRIEIFPTAIPVLTTTVYGSYANDPEQVDAISGAVKFISENIQPVNGAVVMYDTFYGLKESSMYSLQSSPNLEPAQWNEPEVAQRAGSCGIDAYDFGEQWIVEACRNGIYLYEGGLPGKIMQEIYQVWDSLNWTAKQSIWVRNDVKKRRLFVGVPMPTPNFWLPNASVNANPTEPNVILMCNYQGLDSGEEIKAEKSLHVTMFGTLEAGDMRRKWSIWQIPSPYAALVKTSTDEEIYICNGIESSKIYKLDPTISTDDGVAISSLYTTYGFVNPAKINNFPMLGFFRKRWQYLTMTAFSNSSQNMAVRLLLNTLIGPNDSTVGYNAWSVPGGFNLKPVALNDCEASLNTVATRTFVEFSGNDWTLSNFVMRGVKDAWNQLRGLKS
jgi:hypothetical protein